MTSCPKSLNRLDHLLQRVLNVGLCQIGRWMLPQVASQLADAEAFELENTIFIFLLTMAH